MLSQKNYHHKIIGKIAQYFFNISPSKAHIEIAKNYHDNRII
jgi:hypothetical protein